MAEWPNCLRPPQNHFCYRSYPKLNPGKNSLGILTMTQFVKDKFEIKKSICYWSEERTKINDNGAGICPCKKYLNSNFQPFLLSQLLQSIFSLHMTREKNGLKWSWQFLQFVSRNGSCCWCVCVSVCTSLDKKSVLTLLAVIQTTNNYDVAVVVGLGEATSECCRQRF